MKNSMFKLWLLALTVWLSGAFAQNLQAHVSVEPAVETMEEAMFGGAYLQFASKMGGEITKKDVSTHSVLGVEGCARGSRIYQFTLYITRDGKTRTFQAKSNRLSGEMMTELRKLSVGDEFEFKKVKAYLPNGKDSVDVWGKKFTVASA